MSDPFELGPALAFEVHDAGAPVRAGWRPFTDKLTDAALADRVAQIRAALASGDPTDVDERVAASTEQFGLAARLVAAHVCAAALGMRLAVSSSSIWWRPDDTGWLHLSFARSDAVPDVVDEGALPDLTGCIHRLYAVSTRVLWGNVGSAANSTLTLVSTARPDLLDDARAAADRILSHPRVDGGTQRSGPAFRRASCCLIYRATDGLCGDCVLRAHRERRWSPGHRTH